MGISEARKATKLVAMDQAFKLSECSPPNTETPVLGPVGHGMG